MITLFNHTASCVSLNVIWKGVKCTKRHLMMNATSSLTFIHASIWSPPHFPQHFYKWPHLSWHESRCRLARTKINDRNMRPRWSNVNPRHPPRAKGAPGALTWQLLWQWRMRGEGGRGGSHACLASTSHLFYLSELSFQSIRPADIWMVFNILVGLVWNGGGRDGKVCACMCTFLCVRACDSEVGDKGGSRKEWVFERGRPPRSGHFMCLCDSRVRVWCGCLMKSWVDADTAHTHTHNTQTLPQALRKRPGGIDRSHFPGSAQNQRATARSAQSTPRNPP